MAEFMIAPMTVANFGGLLGAMKRAIDKPVACYDGYKIGYARVSTDDQSLNLQIDALRKYGCREDNIHVEKISGVTKVRPKLELALMDARPRDTFVVWKLDRLGRSTIDLLNKIDSLTAREIGFVSLTDNIETVTPGGRLVMTIMAALAEFERNLIVERTKAGQAAARARGVQIGHAPKIDRAKAEQMFRQGKTAADVARHFDVYPSAVYEKWSASQRDHMRQQYLDDLAAKKAAKRKR